MPWCKVFAGVLLQNKVDHISTKSAKNSYAHNISQYAQIPKYWTITFPGSGYVKKIKDSLELEKKTEKIGTQKYLIFKSPKGQKLTKFKFMIFLRTVPLLPVYKMSNFFFKFSLKLNL